MNARLVPLVATLSLTACIPPGGEDFRIGRNSDAPALEEPQLVPEKAIVAETSSWSPAVVERNARQVATSAYIVQPGDSLFAIATKTGAGATAIADANNLHPPYPIRAGDRLQVPGGLYHKVGSGETGIAIARAYGVVWADIVMMNALQPPYTLQVGQNLLLPSIASESSGVSEITPEARAAAFSLNIDDIVTGGQPAGLATVFPSPSANFGSRFVWPLQGTIVGRFGSQGGGRVNDGLNISAVSGTRVRASAPGIVVYSGNEIGVFGGLVLIDHGGGWVTAYGHLGTLNVTKGDRVTAGQTLGGVGDTGYVTQPQLHFEIRKDRKPINPQTVLPASNATG
jgi:murein DD-endopeptidase MepM/ murein hydrolase activator NlpD